jgi:hypothetical protein
VPLNGTNPGFATCSCGYVSTFTVGFITVDNFYTTTQYMAVLSATCSGGEELVDPALPGLSGMLTSNMTSFPVSVFPLPRQEGGPVLEGAGACSMWLSAGLAGRLGGCVPASPTNPSSPPVPCPSRRARLAASGRSLWTWLVSMATLEWCG